MTDYSKFDTGVKIRWYRVLLVWGLFVGLVVLCSVLLGCSGAYAYEDAHSLPIPVLTILAEAGGEGFEGMVAVGNVIRNRAKERRMTIEGICLQKWQFSAWNDGGTTVYRYANKNRAIWNDALTAWQLSGTEDITGGSNHYFANYIKMPKWAVNMKETVKIGQHRFFRG